MSFLDMIRMSAGNLWRRKLRTALTVLGVLIGTASIVAMLSLAVGMKKQLMDEYSSFGSVTQVTVRSGSEGGDSGHLDLSTMLTDSNMEMLSEIDHVTGAMPQLDFSGNFKIGKYEGYAEVIGVDKSILEQQEVETGSLPEGGGNKLPVLVGNYIIYNLGYWQGDEYCDYYSTGELPDVDLTKDLHDLECYNETAYSEDGEDTVETEKDEFSTDSEEGLDSSEEFTDTEMDMGSEDNSMFKLQLNPTGIMAGGQSYGMYSMSLLADIDTLKEYLMRNYGKGRIPNQPRDKGKPLNEWVYNSIVLEVDEAENVDMVQQAVMDLGFEASSNKEMLESMQSTMQIVELVLGGIGMVAFLVAAIGIANTMMMSTYERTKEIGVMKVLGCDMKDIMLLFLAEAAFIGFIGGIVGLGFSEIISFIINSLAASVDGMATGKISVIDWWLALAAVGFSTLMGMVAGYFPARRAMKLSPLAAIHTE